MQLADMYSSHSVTSCFFTFIVLIGSLLDFLKEGDGKFLKLILLVDMAAKVRPIPAAFESVNC